jgi:hypothetical protein
MSGMALILALLAQHCGGSCEVRRGAPPVSPNPKYGLVEGKEKADWRYLFNWIWTEDGKELHRLEGALRADPCVHFGFRRMFVSPAGNGLLVSGNSYVARITDPPLFVFLDPRGRLLTQVTLPPEERRPGPCLNCDCKDVLYLFDEDPRLEEDGCFVTLKTNRARHFFLPLGAPVADRAGFLDRLAELECAGLPPAERQEIDARVRELDSEDPSTREKAASSLIAKGYRALPALRAIRGASEEVKDAVARIERRLKPSNLSQLPIDLDVLAALLSYPEKPVADAARAQLGRILPEAVDADWIRRNKPRLIWDASQGRYVSKH